MNKETAGALRLVPHSLRARFIASCSGLPGMEFDRYGRMLVLREIMERRVLVREAIMQFCRPVSCVRYFEFSFAADCTRTFAASRKHHISALDISSPRLFPFWMVEILGFRVDMINPDRKDLMESRRASLFVKGKERLEFVDDADATRLPFADNSFDLVTSISVIEHIPDAGDSLAMAEFVRVVRPGGFILTTFPVKPEFENEYRSRPYYGTHRGATEKEDYFFQRYYDSDSIASRLIFDRKLEEMARCYWVEEPPGWFHAYEQKWIRLGFSYTVHDSKVMVEHFRDAGSEHPADRMGICCLALKVKKGVKEAA